MAQRFSLAAGEVHVWTAWLDLPPSRIESLFVLLSPDERARAERFRFQHHRHFFVAGHGILRELMAAYTGARASEVTFQYDAFGKPSLDPAFKTPLRFNMSHSAHLAVYAIARGKEVGVDVEFRTSRTADEGVAKQFFSPSERMYLEHASSMTWTERFFAIWTLKESYIKALGVGLSADLQSFDVSPDASLVSALIAHRDKKEIERWIVRPLAMPDGFTGALTAGVPVVSLTQQWWPA